MKQRKIALKDGWQVSNRFEYVEYSALNDEDRGYVESGVPYRLHGHALPEFWLYPVRRDGRLTLSARRLRLNKIERTQRKVRLLSSTEAEAYRQEALDGEWESWSYSGKNKLNLSKDYYKKEMLPELHQSILHAFGAEKDPSTPLGVAWIPPGAYDKSHFHDVDVIVVALSKRNETGKLEVKKNRCWVPVPYDIGEAVLIPKYVEHRVRPTSIDRITATVTLLN